MDRLRAERILTRPGPLVNAQFCKCWEGHGCTNDRAERGVLESRHEGHMKKASFAALVVVGLVAVLSASVHAASGDGEHSALCLVCGLCSWMGF